MSWAIGYDSERDRDIGYGVPAFCDHPGCKAEIDRGLSYRCGEIHEDDGCGLYFCADHREFVDDKRGQFCERCRAGEDPFAPSPDHPSWLEHKETDPSWANWRAERDRGAG